MVACATMATRHPAALARAAEDAAVPFTPAPLRALRAPPTSPSVIRSAPMATFLEILDRRGLLDAGTGRIARTATWSPSAITFDWGGAARREDATRDGLHLLAWLASHPVDQVAVIAGNHDLARVGELWRFDDASFLEARAEADAAYLEGKPRRSEAEFRQAWDLPTWELAARDFASFCVAQRTLVAALLRAGRLRLAQAFAPGLLVSHAGSPRGISTSWALERNPQPRRALHRPAAPGALDAAARPTKAASAIPPLYIPGTPTARATACCSTAPARSPARGVPSPRPAAGSDPAVGHVRDAKTRVLLGIDGAAVDGPLRTLRVQGESLDYRFGVGAHGDATTATMVFLDGGMLHARPEDYQLLDLDAWAPG